MSLTAHRKYCQRPVLGFAVNGGVFLSIFILVKLQFLPAPFYWLAVVFGLNGMLFLMLSIFAPGTALSIDETMVTRSGWILGGSLKFDEIIDARLECDPDARNFVQITLRSRDGKTLLIDPRFLNPDRDGIVGLLRERLRSQGTELKDERPR